MALPQVNSSKYSTKLPSTNETIEFRPYLVKEEKILMIAIESKDQKQMIRAMQDVIQACVYTQIDVKKLTTFDVEWMFVQLRAKSVGEKVDLKLKCTACETLNDIVCDLEKVYVSTPDEDVSNVINFSDTIGITVKHPAVDDVANLKQDAETMEGVMELMAKSVITIFDEDNVYNAEDEGLAEVVKFLENLNSAQFKKITDYYSNIPTVRSDLDFKCKSCGEENKLELKGIQNFFT
tara:strand:+ start:2066 stop:2773 length:708 start_codon:yes stop_codon:yes gene_type:complete